MTKLEGVAVLLTAVVLSTAGIAMMPTPGREPVIDAHEAAAAEMAEAANAFLAALTPEQRAQAGFEMKDDERLNWHYIPRERKGIPFKEMTPAQRSLGHAFLSTGLSQRGYIKAVTIMTLEQILHEIEKNGKFARDPELYFFSVFGKPGPGATWGWRVEGHHLSLNFTIIGGTVIAGSPSFFGTNPGCVLDGPRKGLRVLADEEDLARRLVKSLSDEQRRAAIFAEEAPADILTSAERKVKADAPLGLAGSGMTPDQRENLDELLKVHIQRLRPELAKGELEKVQKDGPEKIHFAWAGGTEPGQGHYYRIQGSTFLIEFDNTQGNANHVHAVWRDFENDFGEDLLRRHYEQNPHPK